MTELVSAMTYANTVLSRMIRQVAATRIQKKWRSWKIEQMAEVERAQAKMHKIENLVGLSWKSKESDKIEDMLGRDGCDQGQDIMPSVKRVKVERKMISPIAEQKKMEEKGTTKFTSLVNSYFHLETRKDSSMDLGKVWADDPSSKDWIDRLERVVLLS